MADRMIRSISSSVRGQVSCSIIWRHRSSCSSNVLFIKLSYFFDSTIMTLTGGDHGDAKHPRDLVIIESLPPCHYYIAQFLRKEFRHLDEDDVTVVRVGYGTWHILVDLIDGLVCMLPFDV